MNIVELVYSLRADDSNLLDILKIVRKDLSGANGHIEMDGKSLRVANVEQSAWLAYYDEIRVHLKTMGEYYRFKVLEQRAKVLRMIAEQSQLSYGENMMSKLAEDDPGLISLQMKKLEVDEVYDWSDSIVNSFKQRGYSLKNISNAVVAQVGDDGIILHNQD